MILFSRSMQGRVGGALALPGSQQFGARRVAQRGDGAAPGGEKKVRKAMGKCRFYRDLVGFHGDFMGFLGC